MSPTTSEAADAAALRLQRCRGNIHVRLGRDLRAGLRQGMALRGLDGSDLPDPAAKLGHLCRILLLTLACAVLVHLTGGGRLADESNTRVLLDDPGATLARAAILQYRPVNTDVLAIFVLLHLLFAPLLWLLLRLPNVTLGASLALYVLVQVFGWTVPAWPNGHWAFNPLAWQLLVVLGAWWMLDDKSVRTWLTSRTVLGLAVLYLLFSLVIALSCRIEPLEALIPQALAKLHSLDKSNLDPLRLLHFLAMAVLAAWFVPRNWRGLMTPVMRGAICCGQNAANLLPRRSAGVRRAHGAVQHLGRACDADNGSLGASRR